MVQVAVCGGGQFQGPEADIVQSLIVNAIGLICVLYKLVDGQGGVVGLDHSVGYLGSRGRNKNDYNKFIRKDNGKVLEVGIT